MRDEEEVAKNVCRKWASKAEAVMCYCGYGCLSLLSSALFLLLLLLLIPVVCCCCR